MTQIQEHFKFSSDNEEAEDISCMESEDAESSDADMCYAWTLDMLQKKKKQLEEENTEPRSSELPA